MTEQTVRLDAAGLDRRTFLRSALLGSSLLVVAGGLAACSLGFHPDRFAEGRRRELPRYAYLPFGAGPRICAGNHFALLESALIVALVTVRVDLRPHGGPPRLIDSGTALRCAGPVPVDVRPVRAGAAA